MQPQKYRLRTLGTPALLDSGGDPVPLTDYQLALVILVRLEKPERGWNRARFLDHVGKKLSPHSDGVVRLMYKHLSRIRSAAGLSIAHGQTVQWIKKLPCDVEVLLDARRQEVPDARELLQSYRPFLEGFVTQVNTSSFASFVSRMAGECKQAMRSIWAREAGIAAAAERWESLLELGKLGLALDPAWEEAYLELDRASARTNPPRPLESITAGRALVAHLGEHGQQRPTLPVTNAIQAAQDLYTRMNPAPPLVPPPPSDSGGELIAEPGSHLVASGTVAWDPAATGYEWDVYLAVPMDSLGERYAGQRPRVLQLLETLREFPECSRVYYAGESLPTPDDYDDEAIALRDCMAHLRRTKFFLMIYPDKLASSVILEVGIALVLRIPGVIFYREWRDLPYLLRGVRSVFPAMHTCRYTSFANLQKLVQDEVVPRLRANTHVPT